jgi:flagella basal body P-ring formation protein FlgA
MELPVRKNPRAERLRRVVAAALALVIVLPATLAAQERQDPAAIQLAVEHYLKAQTSGLPGAVSITVGAVFPRSVLAPCPALEVFQPAGTRNWGSTMVGVRCSGPTTWTLYVAAQVRVTGSYVVTARPVPQGRPLESSDVVTQQGELTQMPYGVLTDVRHALGKTPTINLLPGEPLRQELLRAQLAIQQGQTVKVQSGGSGFKVSAEGLALNNAQEGQLTQVRTASGQTVSGVARSAGVVEVRF